MAQQQEEEEVEQRQEEEGEVEQRQEEEEERPEEEKEELQQQENEQEKDEKQENGKEDKTEKMMISLVIHPVSLTRLLVYQQLVVELKVSVINQ